MPIEVTMPRLSDTMERGTVVKWNVKQGDTVSTGDVLAEIETDKATMDLESFDDGTVATIAVPEGESVAVGEIILIIAEEGEDLATAASSATAHAAKQASGPDTPASPATSTTTQPNPTAINANDQSNGQRIHASPLARKIAAERGIDLSAINGSGPSGRIVKKDVEAAATPALVAPASSRSQLSPPSAPDFDQTHATTVEAAVATAAPLQAQAPPTLMAGPTLEHQLVPLNNMRETIARRLVESKQTIPHYQVSVDADMDALIALRKQLNAQLASQGVKLSVNDFLVRACALAMHQHPFINSRWVQDGAKASIEILPDVNVAIAIALPQERGGGLVVATLRNADRMGLRAISSESKRLSKKAREKGLTIEEMADATFTISNLGMFGVTHFTAIVNPPQVAILAVGAAQLRPVVKNNEVVPGNVMTMTMSSDHRVVDGAMAAKYLTTTRELLENPATLLV